MPFDGVSDRWRGWRERLPLEEYEQRFAGLQASGKNIHGEVDALERLRVRAGWLNPSVLDAGCGTGRIAAELEARGWSVAAVDSDPDMIALARSKSVTIDWHHGDLTDIDLARTFDVVLMAGNILLFVHEGTEAAIMGNMARHVATDGLLVAGFSLAEFPLASYMEWCSDAELEVVEQWATWEGAPYEKLATETNRAEADGTYIVSISRPLSHPPNDRKRKQ